MDGKTLNDFLITVNSASVLVGAVATTVIGTALAETDLSGEGVLQNLLPLGGPAAIGMLVANFISPPIMHPGPKADLVRGLMAGGVTVGLMMGVGAIPTVADSQTAVLLLTVAGGTMIGDYAGGLIS